jgi:hypothetical protein
MPAVSASIPAIILSGSGIELFKSLLVEVAFSLPTFGLTFLVLLAIAAMARQGDRLKPRFDDFKSADLAYTIDPFVHSHKTIIYLDNSVFPQMIASLRNKSLAAL